jgi:hypothetical protein
MNACAVDDNDLNTITSVDVSFSNWVNDILGSLFGFLNILSEFLDQEVMANELIIKNRGTKLAARPLNTICQLVIWTNGIITKDNTLPVLVKTAKQIKRIERHEAAWVECIAEKLSQGLDCGRPLKCALIGLHLGDQELM